MEKIHISTTNEKLGGQIASINMPAGITCRPDAPCSRLCYAMRGNYRFQNVQKAHAENLAAYREDPDGFFAAVSDGTRLFRFVRWHASGDIVDMEYFRGMVKVAEQNTGTDYLAFTKKYEIVNAFIDAGGVIPGNLHIVFSAWGSFLPDNPYGMPVAYVAGVGGDALIPAGSIPCAGRCDKCLACWQLRNGQTVFFKKH